MSARQCWSAAVLLAFLLSVFGPGLDDLDAARATAASVTDAGRAERFGRAAQAMCGPQAAWADLGNGTVQCFTHKGRKTAVATVK